MTKILLSTLLACAVAAFAVFGLTAFAQAQGANDAKTVAVPHDAGPPLDAAIVVVTPPAGPVVDAPDPVEHPAEAYSALRAALKKSIPYGVVLALYMIFAYASARAKPGSWLDKGRLPTIIAAGASTTAALLLAMTGQTEWGAALGAIVAAIFTTLHSDPPKKGAVA